MSEEDAKPKGSLLKIIIPVIVIVAGMGGAGYLFVVKPNADKAAASTTTTEVHGKIVRLEPTTVNLADGHVLKIGIAMQMVAEPEDEHLNALVGIEALEAGGHAKGEVKATMTLDGIESKAYDQIIRVMGKNSFDVLSDPAGRTAAKDELTAKIVEIYHGDVKTVYFTDFVMS